MHAHASFRASRAGLCRGARAAALALVLAPLLAVPVAWADDTALFTTAVPPNVMLMVDNSGSMNHIVWHPAYDPDVAPSCNNWDSGNPDTTWTFSSDLEITACGNTRTLYADTSLDGSTRIQERYLNWYFSDEADPYESDLASLTNGTRSSCLTDPDGPNLPEDYSLYRRARITAAKEVLREVVCQVNAAGEVRFGLAQFFDASDPQGGWVKVPIADWSPAHQDDIDAFIEDLAGEAWTPLSETLYNVYRYFQSRSDPAIGKDGSSEFPAYNLLTSGSTTTPSNAPDSPLEYECQKSFVVIVTDGEPTKDDFDGMDLSGFQSDLIGDYNPENTNPEAGNEYPNHSCALCNETTWYLDDIAKFMQERDFQRDFEGTQSIDTYTVGFTTGTLANQLLEKTADVGNGLFFTSNNAEELTDAIVSSITDIVRKSQSFTATTVPATRVSAGNNLYTSIFVPDQDSPYWEGHLQNFAITGSGEIHDANGACALADPTPGECFSGPFKSSAVPFWDAGQEVPAPGARQLHVSKVVSGTPQRRPFTQAEIAAADLGVTFPPTESYDGSTALNAEGLTDEIVANVRGCELGTGVSSSDVSSPQACEEREWLLGDIFHSDPLVVGPPAEFLGEPSYQAFEQSHATRDRMLYAGANDGFLRGFLAGVWDPGASPPGYTRGTGEEVFGFMPWPSRQQVAGLPLDTGGRDLYFVDGPPSASDAWLYSDPTTAAKLANGSEWRTVLLGGLRQGGEAYYAFDVTDPSAAGYPVYLWEFPAENASASVREHVGETWGEPIVTKIRVAVDGDDNGGEGYERWVAIVTGGYDPSGDPNLHASYDPDARKGRAIYVLDLVTGEPIAEMKFDPDAPSGDPRKEMLYAIPSTPAVIDLDFDGYADQIYVGDLGGNLWKWVIHPIAEDRVNDGSGLTTQPSWTFRRLFQAPSYDDGANVFHKSFFFPPGVTLRRGRLWLAFGSGERQNLGFAGDPDTPADNNRFYAMTDLDPYETASPALASLTEADLVDATNDTTCVDTSDSRGYYLVADEREKFVTNVDIFLHFVFVASYVPDEIADECGAGGTAFLYVFKTYCGEGFFPGSPDPQRRMSLGSGMPTDPRVTVGTGGDASNRIIMNEQSGDIVNIEAPPGFDAGIGQMYWRQLFD